MTWGGTLQLELAASLANNLEIISIPSLRDARRFSLAIYLNGNVPDNLEVLFVDLVYARQLNPGSGPLRQR